MTNWRAALAGAVIAILAVAAPAAAQREPRKPCNLVFTEVRMRDTVTHMQSFKTGTGQYNSFIGGVDAVCVGSDQRILADSAENYGDERRLLLIGNVHYKESKVKLDADRMTYFTAEERISLGRRPSTGARRLGSATNPASKRTRVRTCG
jgi:lipopolysaccharide assembly outer membrane protein LptD (OstA)